MVENERATRVSSTDIIKKFIPNIQTISFTVKIEHQEVLNKNKFL
jgi:hypothetical protein